LKKGGKLLLDITDPDYLKSNLIPLSWHEANKDIIICRKRKLQGNIIKAREVVISKNKGLLRDELYCERLYNKSKVIRILNNIGFKKLSVKRNLSLHRKKEDYGLLNSRMMIVGIKP
jgi:D-alanine-D-alanine ligase